MYAYLKHQISLVDFFKCGVYVCVQTLRNYTNMFTAQ